MSKKIIIGLTGKYCSGKSSVEKILKTDSNYFIIDVDKTGHQALEIKKNELVKTFGKNILNANKINRKILGKIVFNDSEKLAKLNSIVHPFMIKEIKKEINKSKKNTIFINAALLFEMKLDELCNKIIIVESNLFQIILRAKKRDNSPVLQTLRILQSQKLPKKNADKKVIYLDNRGSAENLKNEIKKLSRFFRDSSK